MVVACSPEYSIKKMRKIGTMITQIVHLVFMILSRLTLDVIVKEKKT